PVAKNPEVERLVQVDQKYGGAWQTLVREEKEKKQTVEKAQPQSQARLATAETAISESNQSVEGFAKNARTVGLGVVVALFFAFTLYCLIVGLTRMSREAAGGLPHFAIG